MHDIQGLKSTKELGMPSLMLAGGLGGLAFWTFVYPMDVIKSKIQMQSLSPLEYKGILDCGRKVVATEGVKGTVTTSPNIC
jgi:solute carrier family 25 (mitochondrial carnitine/acylcarnitine transporter), member 20/29